MYLANHWKNRGPELSATAARCGDRLVRQFLVVLGAFALLETGCRPAIDALVNAGGSMIADYRATVYSGRASIPVAVEMETLFPDSTDHFISSFGSADLTAIWNSESFFGGRYILTIQLEVNVDYSRNVVTPNGSPRFWLREVVKTERMSGGRTKARFGPSRKFTGEDWARFKESGGDVSTIGLPAGAEETAGYADYVAAVRRDRKPVISLIK